MNIEQATQAMRNGHRVIHPNAPNEPSCAITCVYPANEYGPAAAWVSNWGHGGSISAMVYLDELIPEAYPSKA